MSSATKIKQINVFHLNITKEGQEKMFALCRHLYVGTRTMDV
jgi:hypothetical protein